jgi:nucleotide-binding universal stress UspA family protein
METKNNQKYNNIILIPTDFSPVCDNAIEHGIELAGFLHYNVCILHVINRETKSKLKKEDLDIRYIEEKLNGYKIRFSGEGKPGIQTRAVEGSIFSVISEVAAEIKANLMVLGTHGKKGLQYLFGSYALKVVLESPVPVIVVQKKTFGDGYHNIVIPINTDTEARQTVQWAQLMAKLFKTPIHLFVSFEKDTVLHGRLKIITAQITEEFDKNEVPYKITWADQAGNFTNQIISYAVVSNSDLIMIMTRPQADLPGFSFAGWDEKLMFNDAQIPVMCLNPLDLGTYYWEWIDTY